MGEIHDRAAEAPDSMIDCVAQLEQAVTSAGQVVDRLARRLLDNTVSDFTPDGVSDAMTDGELEADARLAAAWVTIAAGAADVREQILEGREVARGNVEARRRAARVGDGADPLES